ncbi:MAG: hypothetical protein WCP22_05855 [Chlamydiota bacterium]
MRSLRAAWKPAIIAACAAGAACAAPPEPVPSPSDAQVKRIVEQAIDRGSKVIVKRVDYTDGGSGASPEAPAGPVKSKTYIEIDSRPPGAADDRELIESQKRIEESQREMLRSVEVIGKSQERGGESLSAIQGRGQEMSGGMRGGAAETGALRGEAAGAGGKAGEVGDAVGESEKIMKQIDTQAKELSGSIDELSARMDQAQRQPGGDAPAAIEGAARGAGRGAGAAARAGREAER